MHSHLTRIRLATVIALALPILAVAASPGSPAAAQAGSARVVTAYVLNGGAVTPINTVTNKALKQIPTGGGSGLMVMTPNGKTVYVAGSDNGPAVLPISTATNKPGKLIKIPGGAGAIVITPR